MTKKIEAFIREEKLEDVKKALYDIGIVGMNVFEVHGHGRQGGITLAWRTSTYKVDMLPRYQLNIVLSDHNVEKTIETICKAARTGQQADRDFGQANAHLYIVMEFIPGANLRQMLQDLKAQGQWIALDEAVPLLRQVSLAVDYIHRQGVLHRDIKPNNIMVKPDPSEGLPYRPVRVHAGAWLPPGQHGSP